MTSRSSSYDATALASYQAALAGQLYPPDTQCENIQGTGSYMDRVSNPKDKYRNLINWLKLVTDFLYL